MTALKRLALAVGLIALPLVGHANQVCDLQGKCYEAGPPHQSYQLLDQITDWLLAAYRLTTNGPAHRNRRRRAKER